MPPQAVVQGPHAKTVPCAGCSLCGDAPVGKDAMGAPVAGVCAGLSSLAGAFIAGYRDQGSPTVIPLRRLRRRWLQIGMTGCFALTGACIAALLFSRTPAIWVIGTALVSVVGANLCALLDRYLGHRTVRLEERRGEEALAALGAFAERLIALLVASHLSDVTWNDAMDQWKLQADWPRDASNATVVAAFAYAAECLLRATDPRRSPLEFAEESQRDLLRDATGVVALGLEIQARGLLLSEGVPAGSGEETVGRRR